MKHSVRPLLLFVMLATLLLCQSCNSPRDDQANNVSIWEIDDPPNLHPLLAYDATATAIKPLLFQTLLSFSYDTYELLPVLSTSRPSTEVIGDSTMALTYELRPEAAWDDGTPITAADVAFSFKAVAAPTVQAPYLQPYVQLIDRIAWEESDPKSFTIHTAEVHMRAEVSTGFEVPVLPRHLYDPEGVLKGYTFQELLTMHSVTDTSLHVFGERITSEAFSREGTHMHGSGAYRLSEWVEGQHILLEKKDDWWGSHVTGGDNMFFDAYPDSITYEVISDQTAALTALKAGQLDVMRSVNARDFDDKMKGNARVRQEFNLHEPPMLAYSALGMNMNSPIFSSRQTRQAIAYLTNCERLIEDVMQGYGNRTVGPVFPTLEKYYNDTLKPHSFNPPKAKQLLTADGWRDADGDGILEKSVDGKRLDFEFDFIVNKGQQERETVALILQEDLRKTGIKMNIRSLDWSVVVQKLQSHNFDMMYLSVVSDPAPEDYTQMWSTASQSGGYNFVNFGTPRTDSLIQSINRTLDTGQRAHLVRQFQEIIHHEVPYIYLWNPINRMAISKRFTNTRVSAVRPGFWVPGFRLK